MKSPTERGLTAQRLVDVRKAAGFTNQKDAAAHVRKATGVVGLTDSQWASYESGDPRRPFQQKHREAIESVFGPLNDNVEHQPAPPTDLAALVAANVAVAEATRRFTEAVDFQTQKLDRVWDRLGDLIERLDGQQPLTKADARAMADGLADGIGASLAGAITDLADALRQPSPSKRGGHA